MIDYSRNYVRPRVGHANILNGGILPGILVAAIVPLAFAGVSLSILDITSIPLYAVFTLARMTLAYLLSIGFALAYGITTGLSRRASHVMLPLLDILQSVPVLGFLPAVFFFLKNAVLGAQISSIILIFTAMVWAPTFGVIAGVNAIPQDIKEASQAYGVHGLSYLRQIILPAVYPELVWSSLLAWGGGWYLIPVEENFSFNGTSSLPGLGNYIANAAAKLDLNSSLFGLAVLVLIILAIDELVWRPLGARADKYKYESTAAPQTSGSKPGRMTANVRKYEQRLISPLVSLFKYERASLSSFLEAVHLRRRLHVPERVHLQDQLVRHARMGRIISFVIAITLILVSIPTLRGIQVTSLGNAPGTIATWVEGGYLTIAFDTGASLLRILAAYLIALGWTLGAGILIARNERASKLLVPVFDVVQSIPGTALFPILILLVVNPLRGSALGLNLASILLLLTGMQWYLLFNIVGAVRGLPTDLLEASSAYGIKGKRFVREILLPASFPAILIGSIQAWGGGWNATIVSEYITGDPNNPGAVHQVPGLGALLQTAVKTYPPYASAVVITVAVLIMTITVLTINRVVWRRLLKKAEKFKMEV